MKFSKAHTQRRAYRIPELRFEDQRLSSFSGLVVVQALFSELQLRESLRKCFCHLHSGAINGFQVICLLLVVHVMLGYRRLRELDRYREDPLVLRTLGLRRMPDASTVSRRFSEVDKESVEKVPVVSRQIVLEPLAGQRPARLTLDFDGSVLSTGRFAEGTAVGFNKQKKGKRSYHRLFCTVAKTGQVLDVYHRPGNVHDSNGAKEFIEQRIGDVRSVVGQLKLEARLDSAFFADKQVSMLEEKGVEFTISIPFERFSELKQMIEGRRGWKRLDGRWSYFETKWSPECWPKRFRFIFIGQKVKKQQKEPVQLDLFIPHEPQQPRIYATFRSSLSRPLPGNAVGHEPDK